jgi:hypothetical protein
MKLSGIKKLCKKHKVVYHHHDQFTKPVYSDMDPDLAKAVVVVYSAQYGRWQLAVNTDGSVSRPGDEARETVKTLEKIARELREGAPGWKGRVLKAAKAVSSSARKRVDKRRKARRLR